MGYVAIVGKHMISFKFFILFFFRLFHLFLVVPESFHLHFTFGFGCPWSLWFALDHLRRLDLDFVCHFNFATFDNTSIFAVISRVVISWKLKLSATFLCDLRLKQLANVFHVKIIIFYFRQLVVIVCSRHSLCLLILPLLRFEYFIGCWSSHGCSQSW